MNRIELLAPAGDLERLKTAIRYGADAVYIGGKKFSLRSRASNFDLDAIAEGVRFANEHNAKVFVTINMLPHEEDMDGIEEYLLALEAAGVSAIIVASIYIMRLAKRIVPKMEVHVSTQHSSTSSSVISLYQELGVERVVLARECSLHDVQATMKHTTLPIEVFVHGGMCISYSGRCTLSNNMTSRDANRGGCAQSCRWKYRLYDKDKAIYDENHLFSMSSKDLCAVEHVPQLIEAGVASLKIEGRMKSKYYLATIVRAYRKLIDSYYAKGYVSEDEMKQCRMEISKAENRLTSNGFYEGIPTFKDHLYGVNGAGVSQEYIADVLEYDEATKIATLQVRNNFKSGIEVEVFGPNIDNTSFIVETLYDKDGEILEVAKNPMQIIYTKINIKLQKHDMIRKIINQRENIY